MKKKVQRPFSIEAWKNGAKVETRDGRSVRILCTDMQGEYDIVGLAKQDGCEAVLTWLANGRYSHPSLNPEDPIFGLVGDDYTINSWTECGQIFFGRNSAYDLVIVEEIEEVENTEEHEQYNGDVCGDNRFEIIDAARNHLLDATNISTSPEEMAVLNSFLFRCWQMGWLKDFDTKRVEDTQSTSDEEPERWANVFAVGDGWTINDDDCLANITRREGFSLNNKGNYDLFATERQAKSALAMARISQLMAHDERYGGVVTDEEWGDETKEKWLIERHYNTIKRTLQEGFYTFLAFHTPEQRDLFLKENEQLVKDYLMID